MEIVKQGVKPGDVEYHGTCLTCKTEVKFKRSEAKEVGDQKDGDYLTVRCPVCGSAINTNLNQRRR